MTIPLNRLEQTKYAVYDIPSIGGGTSGGGGVSPVATRPQLTTAIDASALTNGALAFTADVPGYWELDKASTLVLDNVNAVATSNGVGAWVRAREPQTKYINQTTWFVSALTGSDTNSGLVGFPLATFGEYYRRTHAMFGGGSVIMTVLDSPSDQFPYAPAPVNGATTNDTFLLIGSFVPIRTGAMTAAATDINLGTNSAPTVTDAGVANWTPNIGQYVYTTSGATPAAAVILKDLGAGVAEVSQWFSPSNPAALVAPPANGTTYVVNDMTPVNFSEAAVGGSANFKLQRLKLGQPFRTRMGYRASYFECQIFGGTDNSGAATGGAQLIACSIGNADMQFEGSGETLFLNCGMTSQLIVGGGAHVTLQEFVMDGLGVGGGISIGTTQPTGEVGGWLSIVDAGIFNVPGNSISCLRDGTVRLSNGAILYGKGNTTGVAVNRGGRFMVRSGYTPTLTGTTEIVVGAVVANIQPIGTNQSGTNVALVGGTKTVAATAVSTTASIRVSRNTPAGTLGAGGLAEPQASRVVGTQFVVNSVDLTGALVNTDTSTFDWNIEEPPAPCTTWTQWRNAPFNGNVMSTDFAQILTN